MHTFTEGMQTFVQGMGTDKYEGLTYLIVYRVIIQRIPSLPFVLMSTQLISFNVMQRYMIEISGRPPYPILKISQDMQTFVSGMWRGEYEGLK